jgi:hypothetical protein
MATRPACYPGCGGCARIPDYPRAKLDIKLVVERRDGETLAAIASLGLPARYDVIVAPPGKPQGCAVLSTCGSPRRLSRNADAVFRN